ncbi:hypothetical protein BDF22DRAFT_316019 [Syncephalis plumigaleata]|nr:hypothetical protein BDF22DRAFT_316019 [Syncephalis plumigaleata]
MPMGSPHPVPTHDAIFDRSAKSHEQVDSNLPLLDKIYGKPPTHLPTSYLPSSSSSSSASVPSVQQQQLHERVNARFGTATTSLGSTLARRIYGQRNSFYSAASQDNSHIMPRPPSSIPLSRTPSLTVSSSGSCESLASSAASHASSTPAVMSRSNSQNRVRRSSIVSNDASLLPPNTKVTRKPSITRIPTASSLPVTTNNDTIALHNASSDSLPNRRYSTLETASQWRSSIQPSIRSHRSCDSISSVDSTLNESDNAQKLLVSIRTRHDRLISMLDNIRNRMAQVRQSWEEDENDRQQYIARLRHSVLLEHDLPSVEPSSPTTYRKSRRSSLPAPTLPAKSTRRQAPMSSALVIRLYPLPRRMVIINVYPRQHLPHLHPL